MKSSKQLLQELSEITKQCISKAEAFKSFSLEQLNFKKDAKSWSILECLEHLNLYGDFYISEIDNQINSSKYLEPKEGFNSSILGSYFVKSMKVNGDKIKGMKTFSNMDPKNSNLSKSIIDRFITQQEAYLKLIEKAQSVDLTKTKTSITISKLIKLRLCDTLMVVVYHNERHVWQAGRIAYQS